MKPCAYKQVQHNSGVSEVLGVIILVSIIVLAFGIVSVVLVSQPQKEKVPEINTVITNLTNSTTGQNIVYITHTGGDVLKNGQYFIFVNYQMRNFNLTGGNGDSDWNAGETLVVSIGNETPAVVQIYYKGATESDLLVEHTLGQGITPTQTV